MGDLALFGHDLFGDPVQPAQAPLASRFTFPPFSVLDGRSGDWQDRKAGWISLGIESELGRGADLWTGDGAQERLNRLMGHSTAFKTGTSVFDPVVCELAYRWFSPPGGQVVDPFAGGSVRGIVASLLGRNYWGCDLSGDQVAANRGQADRICREMMPRWVCGDSTTEVAASAPPADLIFSCPPYGDLERYSDDPRDLSAMDYREFIEGYRSIISGCFDRLRNDRFACFVVGEFRDKRGNYRGFVADTIAAFQECGFHYYNEGILLTPTGTLPVRAGKQFGAGRKLGKAHQNILVFLKGNARAATAAAGEL